MKLINLKIDGQYKSLTNFEYDFKDIDYQSECVEPICFVGLNGSGKSNIIEALSEIFCFLELYCLDYKKTGAWAKQSSLSFTVKYSLVRRNKEVEVEISAKKDKKPILLVESKQINSDDPQAILEWLPERIIGYTSGDNETISFSFLRNQGFYADEIADVALKDEVDVKIEHTRSLFMDYEVNALILLSNYIFTSRAKLDIFREFLRIRDVSSFRIKVSLEKRARKKVKITPELENIIERLKECAILQDYVDSEKTWIFDYILNDATRSAFKQYFQNSETLFTSLYKLNLLNSLRLSRAERSFYTARPKKDALLEKPPVVPKDDRVFLVDQLKLHIDRPSREIDYVGISDGEHQFIHIIGTVMLFPENNCLFLFDEPESHYNPNWRINFINILDRQTASKNPEIIISTHSPYIVSACQQHNVIKFQRLENNIVATEPRINTFGATFDSLLKELFDIKSTIAMYSSGQLEKLLQEKDLEKLQQAVTEFGESPEKRRLYEAIIRLENAQQGS